MPARGVTVSGPHSREPRNRWHVAARSTKARPKILYEGPEPGTLIQYFKDDATAFNAQKKGTISGKGVLNNRISEHVFTMLGNIRRADPTSYGVSTCASS